MVGVRRGPTHINSYHQAVQQCARSNMDINVILGNGDARGLVFYILMSTTESTRTGGTVLPLLADAVSRLQKEGEDFPSSERARKIVQSSLCNVLSGRELGAPAAVCKIMGWSESIKSYKPILCCTRPVFAWIRSSLAEEDRRQEESSGNESSEDEILVAAREGRLAVSTKVPQDYIHRCGRGDTSHPLYDLSYFMYTPFIGEEGRCQRWICLIGCPLEGRRPRGVSPVCSSARLGGECAAAPADLSEPTGKPRRRMPHISAPTSRRGEKVILLNPSRDIVSAGGGDVCVNIGGEGHEWDGYQQI